MDWFLCHNQTLCCFINKNHICFDCGSPYCTWLQSTHSRQTLNLNVSYSAPTPLRSVWHWASASARSILVLCWEPELHRCPATHHCCYNHSHICFLTPLLWLSTDIQAQPRHSEMSIYLMLPRFMWLFCGESKITKPISYMQNIYKYRLNRDVWRLTNPILSIFFLLNRADTSTSQQYSVCCHISIKKHHTCTFEKLQPVYLLHFCFKSDLKSSCRTISSLFTCWLIE